MRSCTCAGPLLVMVCCARCLECHTDEVNVTLGRESRGHARHTRQLRFEKAKMESIPQEREGLGSGQLQRIPGDSLPSAGSAQSGTECRLTKENEQDVLNWKEWEKSWSPSALIRVPMHRSNGFLSARQTPRETLTLAPQPDSQAFWVG